MSLSVFRMWQKAIVGIYERIVVNLAGRDGPNSRTRVREKIVVVLNGKKVQE